MPSSEEPRCQPEPLQSGCESFPPGAADLRRETEHDGRGVEPIRQSDPERGVWVYPEFGIGRIRDGVRRPEFQVACLEMGGRRVASDDLRNDVERITRDQIPLLETHFNHVLADEGFPTRRDIGRLAGVDGLSSKSVQEIVAALTLLVRCFGKITDGRYARVQMVTERGPRKLELEGGERPRSFHIDEARLRLVATLVGAPTVFALRGGDKGGGFCELGRLEEPDHPLDRSPSTQGKFDLSSAVAANYRSLMNPDFLRPGEPLYTPPHGHAVLFSGSHGALSAPLVHTAPQPRTLEEALAWSRLVLIVDEY